MLTGRVAHPPPSRRLQPVGICHRPSEILPLIIMIMPLLFSWQISPPVAVLSPLKLPDRIS